MKLLPQLLLLCIPMTTLPAFEPDTSPQPATHPPLTPVEGEVVSLNPPPMIWRVDDRAASYILELSQDEHFAGDVVRIEEIDLPFFNHAEQLPSGPWHWRYFVVTAEGDVSSPSPTRSFLITEDAVPFPIPNTKQILAEMPDHPRIFTTPDDLEAFRARRHGPARDAWREVVRRADAHLDEVPRFPRLVPLDEAEITGPTPGSNYWREGQPVRRQIFFTKEGEAWFAPDYGYRDLNSDAAKASTLAYAYLISGEQRYAAAARRWAVFVAQARVDFHLGDAARAAHDTAVYCYEQGLKNIAVTYDRIHQYLDDDERVALISHVEYHGLAAYRWLRDQNRIHLEYQRSHPQQAMHPLLTTALAVATESEAAAEWMDYLLRQYVNRIAWTSDDGGYFEGQTYGHKFQWILEALVSLRTATGIDVFKKPRIRNSGDFWLYCMSLNYWYEHGGDIYSLIWPFGNRADGYITNLMASMNEDRYVQWWSDTVFTDPVHIPFQYISQTALKPKPPVDIAQARLFPETGQLAAYERFYDHQGNRIFFRSSQWGGHSHAHADQNNFVIHANGEIMAADVGYYTYYGDDYHMKWTVTSEAHNTVLVNGKGQPKSIESKGEIIEFFESPAYTFFVGDASKAYEEPLERFKRSILFIRPDIWVVYDELKASEPSEFSWLLNAFAEAHIDEQSHSLVVPQRDTRLRVDHLLPRSLTYEQSNERRYPIQTRQWSRFTEAFPEPWHTRVTTAPSTNERILALMHAYEVHDGKRLLRQTAIENDHTVGLRMEFAKGREISLFRRSYDQDEAIHDGGISSDALAVSLSQPNGDRTGRWMAMGASELAVNNTVLFRSDARIDISMDYDSPAARAQVLIQGEPGSLLELSLPDRPNDVLVAPPNLPAEATEAEWQWNDGVLQVRSPVMNDWVLWVDPIVDPRAPLPLMQLLVKDSRGSYLLDLELAITDNGEWIAFAEVTPREPGVYELKASSDQVDLLIQDRFDPALSVRAAGSTTGPVRDATEIFARFAPGEPPVLQLTLQESHLGRIINYLRNGDFEEGIPDYPPRGWTLSRTSANPDPVWPGWSQEAAHEGQSSMRISRPTAAFSTNSQPMRLRTGGNYVLRFMAKGNATHARVTLSSGGGIAGTVTIEPSDDWREYRLEREIEPGYAQLNIRFNAGGEPDQILWIDDMEFGPIGMMRESP